MRIRNGCGDSRVPDAIWVECFQAVGSGVVLASLRISGVILLIAGVLSLSFIPMWGRQMALASVALFVVGAITLAAGTRRGQSRDSESGGVYGDASGANADWGVADPHAGHDRGHGADGGDVGGH
jgi:hypothetical protein